MENEQQVKSVSNTFIVQILYQQNNTWQGTIKWVDAERTEHFRSALEMIRLMDDALSNTAAQEEQR